MNEKKIQNAMEKRDRETETHDNTNGKALTYLEYIIDSLALALMLN